MFISAFSGSGETDIEAAHGITMCIEMRLLTKMLEGLNLRQKQLIKIRYQISLMEYFQELLSSMKNFACYKDSINAKKTLKDYTQISRTFEHSHEDRSCTTPLKYGIQEMFCCLQACQMKEKTDDNLWQRHVADGVRFEETSNNQVKLSSCFPHITQTRCLDDCIPYVVDTVVLVCRLYEQCLLEESLLLAMKIYQHILGIICYSCKQSLIKNNTIPNCETTRELSYQREVCSQCSKENGCMPKIQLKMKADIYHWYSKRVFDDKAGFEQACKNQVQPKSCFLHREGTHCFEDSIQYEVDVVVVECRLYEQRLLEESLILSITILCHVLAISCCPTQKSKLKGATNPNLETSHVVSYVSYQRINSRLCSKENCTVEGYMPKTNLKMIANTEAHPMDSDEKDKIKLIGNITTKDQCSEKVVNNVKAIRDKRTGEWPSPRQKCGKRKVGLLEPLNFKVLLMLAFILPSVCAFPISNEISRSSSEITISKQILLTQTCNHYTLYDLSNSCQLNGELLKITIDNCKFRELCNPEEEPVCINTQYHWAIICQNRNMKCAKGRMIKTWIDKNNPDVMNLKEQQCPKGYFQPYESDCFDACKYKHRDLEDISEKYLVHSKGTDTSPSLVYCNYQKGYYSINEGTYLLDYDTEEQHDQYFCVKGNSSAICTDGGILLPNGTCVVECAEKFSRDDFDGFKCKPILTQELLSSISPTVQVDVDDKDKETISSGGRAEDKRTSYLPSDAIIVIIVLSTIVIAVGVTIAIMFTCNKFGLCARNSNYLRSENSEEYSVSYSGTKSDIETPSESTEISDEDNKTINEKTEIDNNKNLEAVVNKADNRAENTRKHSQEESNENIVLHNHEHMNEEQMLHTHELRDEDIVDSDKGKDGNKMGKKDKEIKIHKRKDEIKVVTKKKNENCQNYQIEGTVCIVNINNYNGPNAKNSYEIDHENYSDIEAKGGYFKAEDCIEPKRILEKEHQLENESDEEIESQCNSDVMFPLLPKKAEPDLSVLDEESIPLLNANTQKEDQRNDCSKERQKQTEQDLSERLFDSGEPFKKPFDSTLDQFSMEHHTKLMESVGVLIVKQTPAGTPRKAGTVFRVGTRFLMTARHVIKSIVDPKDTGKPDWSFFKNGNIYVNFNASLLCTGRVDYDVELILSSDDQDLDFAILGITITRPLPNKMLLQSEFETLNEKQVSIIGFGHTTNYNNKHIDTGCQIVSPNSKRVLKAKKYVKLNSTHFKSILCEENGQGPSIVDRCYSAIDRRHNLTTDCFMEHGASGAPAVTPSGWVVGFLTDGLPELYFKLPENEQKRFSSKHRFEIILKMDYIYIYLKDKYPELAADIFNK